MEVKETMLGQLPLFARVGHQLPRALAFLDAVTKHYQAGETLVNIGDPLTKAGIVTDGLVEESCIIENYHKITLDHFGPGQLFGASFAAEHAASPMQLTALADCTVLWVDLGKLTAVTSFQVQYQKQLAANLLHLLARQGMATTIRLHIASQQTIHDKVLAYLHTLPQEGGYRLLPYNQTELAEHLGVNRSALARVWNKMRAAGQLGVDGQRVRVAE